MTTKGTRGSLCALTPIRQSSNSDALHVEGTRVGSPTFDNESQSEDPGGENGNKQTKRFGDRCNNTSARNPADRDSWNAKALPVLPKLTSNYLVK
jgi:hypothetical protein